MKEFVTAAAERLEAAMKPYHPRRRKPRKVRRLTPEERLERVRYLKKNRVRLQRERKKYYKKNRNQLLRRAEIRRNRNQPQFERDKNYTYDV